jgi:ketosteroid isomerase-like protein
MSAEDLELAQQFLDALAVAAKTGDRNAVYPLLAPDVEWVMPKRDLRGIDEVRDQLSWVSPPDNLDVDFDPPEVTDLGDGRISSDVHEIYRVRETGEFAYARDRRVELTIRDGTVARYEMKVVG